MAWKRLITSGFFFILGIAVLVIGGNITGGVVGVADWQNAYYVFFAALLFFISGFFLLFSLFFNKRSSDEKEDFFAVDDSKPLSSFKQKNISRKDRN